MKRAWLIFLLVGLVFCLASCSKKAKGGNDYFPLNVGARWEYEIVVMGQPQLMQETRWPMPEVDKEVVRLNKSYFSGPMTGNTRVFRLAFFLEDPTGRPESWFPFIGAKYYHLRITSDTAGIYGMYQDVYWAKEADGDVFEVDVLPASSPESPFTGDEAFTQGYAVRPLFFPGGRIQYMEVGKYQKLQCKGFEKKHLLFERRFDISASEAITSVMPGSISREKMYYDKGKGMTLLSQSIDGELTMIWTLKFFSK